MANNKDTQRGGSHADHVRAGTEGGNATAEKHGPDFYREIGKKGGQASPGKFKKGDKRTEEAARKGGQNSHRSADDNNR